MAAAFITVLATGGTIAGMAGSALRHDYRPGQIGIAEFLERVGVLDLGLSFAGKQIANIGSEDISPPVWARLHEECTAALADPTCTGIIITHGTDTVEETAFLLDLTLPTSKPVVLVGAMRPADAVGYDGLRNFANAARVASDPEAAGRGVVVVMDDHVFAARDVRKARTRGADAFRGFPRGSIALVTPSALDWFGAPWRTGEAARFAYREHMPEVVILPIFAAVTPDYVDRLCAETTRGIVVAGVGEGNMPEPVRRRLAERARDGIAVVRASRTDEGLVDRLPEDDSCGFIAARALSPQKARILLQLLLADGLSEPSAMQAAFDRR